MTNIGKILAVALTMVAGTIALSGTALAGVDSPFYPDHLKNPNVPAPSIGGGSGIPAPYRLTD
jgi:hypothetical protein